MTATLDAVANRKKDKPNPTAEQKQAEGAELLGPDGLLSQVTKAVLERALAEEMTGHLGYDKHGQAAAATTATAPPARRCLPMSAPSTWPCRGIVTAPSSRRSCARGRPG